MDNWGGFINLASPCAFLYRNAGDRKREPATLNTRQCIVKELKDLF